MNIVVTSPKDADLTHKLDDVENSFWTLHSKPKNFEPGEIIWIVKDGHVVGGFYVRQIEKISEALEDAEGHNPSQGYRFWFDSEVSEDDGIGYGVLSEDGDFLVKVRGFQGFRYQWWREAES